MASYVPLEEPDSEDPTVRRMPGVSGRQTVGKRVCSKCGELNYLGETHCARCNAELDPKQPILVILPPPPAPEPAPTVVVVQPPPAPPWWWWWPLGLIGIAVVARIVIAIFDI
jgi:hypothetical protein